MALTDADGSTVAAADEGALADAAAAAAALEQQESVDMIPRTALSGGVKRKTYAAWFSRPGWAQGGDSGSWSCRRRSCALFRGSAWDCTRCRWRPAGLQR